MKRNEIPRDIENAENFLRTRITPKGYKKKTKTAAEKRERKNKSSFWTARKVA